MKKISVKDAILRGHLVLSIPTIIILIVVMGSFYLNYKYDKELKFYLFIVFILSLGIIYLYGRIIVRKYKIWVYLNVDSLEKFKVKAVSHGLFNRKENFNDLKIKYYELRMKKGLLDPNNYEDKSIPEQYVIKLANHRLIIFFFFLIITLATLFLGNIILGVGLLLACIWLYYDHKKLKNRNENIVISGSGIFINETMYSWIYISEIYSSHYRSSSEWKKYLYFSYGGQKKEFLISNYRVTVNKMNYLIKVFKYRFEMSELHSK